MCRCAARCSPTKYSSPGFGALTSTICTPYIRCEWIDDTVGTRQGGATVSVYRRRINMPGIEFPCMFCARSIVAYVECGGSADKRQSKKKKRCIYPHERMRGAGRRGRGRGATGQKETAGHCRQRRDRSTREVYRTYMYARQPYCSSM